MSDQLNFNPQLAKKNVNILFTIGLLLSFAEKRFISMQPQIQKTDLNNEEKESITTLLVEELIPKIGALSIDLFEIGNELEQSRNAFIRGDAPGGALFY